MNGTILENYVVVEIMKPGLSTIDRDNYIVPVWMI